MTTYPTSATAFYARNPELLSGAETEGAAATFTTDTATVVYALNLGTAIPAGRRRRLSFTQPAAAGPSDTTGSSEF